MTSSLNEPMSAIRKVNFIPVILGADLGAYALARSFYEYWGFKPFMVTSSALTPIKNSKLVRVHKVKTEKRADRKQEIAATMDELVVLGKQLKEKYPAQPAVLIANYDTYVLEVQKRAKQLAPYFRWAFPSPEVIEKTNSKMGFALEAERFGMTVPKTLNINLDSGVAACLEQIKAQIKADAFSYPLIIKSTQSYGYELLMWEGKAKVYTAVDGESLQAVLEELETNTRDHADAREFVVQPRVDGNDSYNLSITAYADSKQNITFLGSAHVLLEEHDPILIGNPAAMITEPYPKIYNQVIQFLQGVKWHGFANFDVKVDSNTGIAYFFEVNPRIGRNMYYNTAANNNPLPAFVADMLGIEAPGINENPEQILYSVLPLSLVVLYTRGKVRKQVLELIRKRRTVHPLLGKSDFKFSRSYLQRQKDIGRTLFSQWKQFSKHYPLKALKEQGADSFDTSSLQRGD